MSEPVPLTPLEPWIATKIGAGDGRLAMDALRAYQLERLNETLALVQERSAHYRRYLGSMGTHVRALEDLGRLPLTTPQQLRTAPLDFLCVGHDKVERIVTLPTSGTTGPPKRVFFAAEDQELTRDFFHRGMSTLVEPGDRVLILLPGESPGSVGDLLRDGLARMEVEGIPHGPVTDPRATLEVMEAERVTALVGVPVQVLQLAKTVAREGRRHVALKSVLLSTDRVPRVAQRIIEETWGCAVYNHYGSTEMGLGGGVDCRARAGYHVREADLLFEIVDPATGRPVPEGESGEVVFTTLTRVAMPLMRYRTGDVSRFLPGTCACGTVLKRMAHVDERLDGSVVLPGGGILRQSDLDEALLGILGVADFKARYAEEKGRATLRLRVLCQGGGPLVDERDILRALRAIPALSGPETRTRVFVDVCEWGAGREGAPGAAKRTIEPSEEGTV